MITFGYIIIPLLRKMEKILKMFGILTMLQAMREGLLDIGCKVRTMCLPDRFIDQASPAEMYRDAGLDTTGIVAEVCRVLGRDPKVVDLHAARS